MEQTFYYEGENLSDCLIPATEQENEFTYTLRTQDCDALGDEWYRAMKGLEAMTQIKCMIHVEW